MLDRGFAVYKMFVVAAVALSCVLALSGACPMGEFSENALIRNRRVTEEEGFRPPINKILVSIEWEGEVHDTCNGVALKPDMVITVRECTTDITRKPKFVIYQSVTLRESTKVEVLKVYKQNSAKYNLAILILAGSGFGPSKEKFTHRMPKLNTLNAKILGWTKQQVEADLNYVVTHDFVHKFFKREDCPAGEDEVCFEIGGEVTINDRGSPLYQDSCSGSAVLMGLVLAPREGLCPYPNETLPFKICRAHAVSVPYYNKWIDAVYDAHFKLNGREDGEEFHSTTVVSVLFKKESFNVHCGGVFLSRRMVVTAARCVEYEIPSNVEIFHTKSNLQERERLAVLKILIPKGYEWPCAAEVPMSDIALLFLKEGPLSWFFATSLERPSFQYIGAARLYGNGKILRLSDYITSEVGINQQKAGVAVTSRAECVLGGIIYYLQRGQFCFEGIGVRPDIGDVGSPIVAEVPHPVDKSKPPNQIVVGIVSYFIVFYEAYAADRTEVYRGIGTDFYTFRNFINAGYTYLGQDPYVTIDDLSDDLSADPGTDNDNETESTN